MKEKDDNKLKSDLEKELSNQQQEAKSRFESQREKVEHLQKEMAEKFKQESYKNPEPKKYSSSKDLLKDHPELLNEIVNVHFVLLGPGEFKRFKDIGSKIDVANVRVRLLNIIARKAKDPIQFQFSEEGKGYAVDILQNRLHKDSGFLAICLTPEKVHMNKLDYQKVLPFTSDLVWPDCDENDFCTVVLKDGNIEIVEPGKTKPATSEWEPKILDLLAEKGAVELVVKDSATNNTYLGELAIIGTESSFNTLRAGNSVEQLLQSAKAFRLAVFDGASSLMSNKKVSLSFDMIATASNNGRWLAFGAQSADKSWKWTGQEIKGDAKKTEEVEKARRETNDDLKKIIKDEGEYEAKDAEAKKILEQILPVDQEILRKLQDILKKLLPLQGKKFVNTDVTKECVTQWRSLQIRIGKFHKELGALEEDVTEKRRFIENEETDLTTFAQDIQKLVELWHVDHPKANEMWERCRFAAAKIIKEVKQRNILISEMDNMFKALFQEHSVKKKQYGEEIADIMNQLNEGLPAALNEAIEKTKVWFADYSRYYSELGIIKQKITDIELNTKSINAIADMQSLNKFVKEGLY